MMGENRSTNNNQNCDPGWNDPPKLEIYSNYMMNTNTAGAAAANSKVIKPKLNLTKRVAFPLNTNCSNDEFKINQKIEKSAGGLPMPFAKMKHNPKTDKIHDTTEADGKSNKLSPPPPPTLPPPPPQSSSSSKSVPQITPITASQTTTTPTKFYEYTMGIFDKCCNSIKSDILLNNNSFNVNDNNTQIDEIQKRLTIMKSLWIKDDLDEKIQYILWNIAKALDNENPNEAMHLQRSLIEYTNVCSQFLPALRQLIILMTPQTQTNIDDGQSDIVVDNDRLIYTNTTTIPNINQDILSNVLPNDTTAVESVTGKS